MDTKTETTRAAVLATQAADAIDAYWNELLGSPVATGEQVGFATRLHHMANDLRNDVREA